MASKLDKNEIDAETQKIAHEGEELKAMVRSEGWVIAKRKLLEKIANLMNIGSVDIINADANNLMLLIGARKTAADILSKFLKDVEGSVAQHDGNKDMMKSVEEIFIVRQGNN